MEGSNYSSILNIIHDHLVLQIYLLPSITGRGWGWVLLSFGLSGQIGKHMIHIGLIESFFQLLGCPHRTNLAVDHDRDAVAIFCLVHVMGRHEDGDAS